MSQYFDLQFLQKILLVAVVSFEILLGAVVLGSNHRSARNRYFFMASLATAFWALSGYFVYYPPVEGFLTQIARFNFSFVAIWLFSVYMFIRNFPEEQKTTSTVDVLIVMLGIIFSAVSAFTPHVVSDIRKLSTHLNWEFGFLESPFYIYAVFVAIAIFALLVHKLINTEHKNRPRVSLIIFGGIVVVVLNGVFNIILPYLYPNLNLYWVGDYSYLIFLAFTAYAIVRHQLFDIKVVATEAIVVFLSLFLFIQIFTSSNATEQAVSAIIWLVATYGGWLLIKSVKREIEQREQIEKLAKNLGEANEELKVLDKAKDDFLSMASHELNTPIAAIEGYLSMIIDEGIGEKLGATTKKYLEQVYFSAKRLASLVSDLLNVSRIESGRIHLVYSEGQIEDTIEQAIAEIKPEVDKFKHNLIFHKPKSAMPKTYYDIPRITEVVINIIGNAAKYTPEGGKVDVSVEKNEDNIKVSIADNGKGIPSDKKDKVFDKFTQADILKDEVKGTGLGLYIVKNFIEMHKGKVWFDSVVGKGTTFYFTIPILKTKPEDPHEGQGSILH
jgi:signal transduction histidine kinase